MTPSEKIAFKNKLKQVCQAVIEQRIATARAAIDNAQEAANDEEKSSAGDKYETARAMGHLEKDMHAHQLAAHLKELAALQLVNTNTIYTTVNTGAFVQCATASFFVAAGLGKQLIDGNIIFFLSPQAPLTQVLQGKKAGDSFLFNSVANTIIEVY